MSESKPDNLEPIEPTTAQRLYLEFKESHVRESTLQSHRYKTKFFVEWCEEDGIANLNELSGRDLHEYRHWRSTNADMNKVSLNGQMSTLRVFLKWCASIEAVDPGLYEKVMIPSVDRAEERRDEIPPAERAEEILEYLSRYHFASRKHVILTLLWETGMRLGSLYSLDLDDVDLDDLFLSLEHRPDTGTTLKNDPRGERPVAISTELGSILASFIEDIRIDVTDEFGREPLLTAENGRLGKTTIRRDVYKITAPCFQGKECPDSVGGDHGTCGESVSPHSIRRGSITHHLTKDIPVM